MDALSVIVPRHMAPYMKNLVLGRAWQSVALHSITREVRRFYPSSVPTVWLVDTAKTASGHRVSCVHRDMFVPAADREFRADTTVSHILLGMDDASSVARATVPHGPATTIGRSVEEICRLHLADGPAPIYWRESAPEELSVSGGRCAQVRTFRGPEVRPDKGATMDPYVHTGFTAKQVPNNVFHCFKHHDYDHADVIGFSKGYAYHLMKSWVAYMEDIIARAVSDLGLDQVDGPTFLANNDPKNCLGVVEVYSAFTLMDIGLRTKGVPTFQGFWSMVCDPHILTSVENMDMITNRVYNLGNSGSKYVPRALSG